MEKEGVTYTMLEGSRVGIQQIRRALILAI